MPMAGGVLSDIFQVGGEGSEEGGRGGRKGGGEEGPSPATCLPSIAAM
jgi:hypothetical protein